MARPAKYDKKFIKTVVSTAKKEGITSAKRQFNVGVSTIYKWLDQLTGSTTTRTSKPSKKTKTNKRTTKTTLESRVRTLESIVTTLQEMLTNKTAS